MTIGDNQLFHQFCRDNGGSAAIEYSLLIGMICLIVAAVGGLGGGVQTMYMSLAEKTRLAFNP